MYAPNTLHTEYGSALLTPESIASADAAKKMVGSVMVFEMETLEDVKKLIEGDIYYKTGVVSLSPSSALCTRPCPHRSIAVGSGAHRHPARRCPSAVIKYPVKCNQYILPWKNFLSPSELLSHKTLALSQSVDNLSA